MSSLSSPLNTSAASHPAPRSVAFVRDWSMAVAIWVSLISNVDPIRLYPPFKTRSPGSHKAPKIAKVSVCGAVELLTE